MVSKVALRRLERLEAPRDTFEVIDTKVVFGDLDARLAAICAGRPYSKLIYQGPPRPKSESAKRKPGATRWAAVEVSTGDQVLERLAKLRTSDHAEVMAALEQARKDTIRAIEAEQRQRDRRERQRARKARRKERQRVAAEADARM